MNKPTLTIVTVVYNGEMYIEDTIKSVLSQNCNDDIEYIIIDGASTDNTLNIVNSYKMKFHISFLKMIMVYMMQ
ncbi:Putative teichuronic acid biosynthesis glycosyltransferase TuaG [Escherichia coli]|nr:Putative teichuronic acid biosynthesis glycosyltransferase TuaG [Escherichia coli]